MSDDSLGIEHTECFACHGTGKFEAAADEDRPALTCAECDGKGQYAVVRASAHQGAVEDNEVLRRLLWRIAKGEPWDPAEVYEAAGVDPATAGGQS